MPTATLPSQHSEQAPPRSRTIDQIALVLGSGVPLASMVAILGPVLGSIGISLAVVQSALYLAVSGERAIPKPMIAGPAVQTSLSLEALYRAAYLLAAAQRLQAGVNQGVPLAQLLATEKRYLALHIAAQLNRRAAADAVDRVRRETGTELIGWKAVMDEKTSPECRAADGKNFHAGIPPTIGFPGAVHVHCFPAGTLVSGPKAEASTSRWYEGELVEIETRSGAILTATPNHPVLTSQGWVRAGLLVEGSEVIREIDLERPVGSHPDDHQDPTPIEDVAGSCGEPGSMVSTGVPVTSEDFHGDGIGSQVAVVRADRLLWDDRHASVEQPRRQLVLAAATTLVGAVSLTAERQAFKVILREFGPTDSVVSGLGIGTPLLGRPPGSQEPVGLRHPSALDPSLSQPSIDDLPGNAVPLSELVDRHPGRIVEQEGVIGWVDPIVRRIVRLASCHVYNLQTATGWYVANGVVVHNCRCKAVAAFVGAPLVDAFQSQPQRVLVAA